MTTPSELTAAAAPAVEDIFQNLGIDHLVSTVKDVLNVKNLLLLKYVTREEFEEVLKAVDVPAERRALLAAFQQITGIKQETKVESVETKIRDAIKKEGLDDNDWVRKIVEGFKLETVEQLKLITEEQVEVFLKPISAPMQAVLIRVFEKVTKIDIAKLNIPEKPKAQKLDVTAAEAVRSVQGGILCQGIFLTESIDQLLQERDMVIDVSENLEFKETRSVHEIFHNEFTCTETMQTFVNHLDKNLSERSALLGVNIWGVSLGECDTHPTQLSSVGEAGNYIASVHYQRIPMASVHITPNDIYLRPEVINALQHVEKSLKETDYEPKDHFKDIFKMYGTHINHGTVEFGGILVSTAYCEDFCEEDRGRITDSVIEASEAALLLDVAKKVHPSQPLNAFEVLGTNTGMNDDDLKNITVVVKKIGGTQNVTEKEEWKETLRDDCKLWKIVQRISQPKPMWKMLQQHKDQFENYLGIVNAMQEEWKLKHVSACSPETRDLKEEDEPKEEKVVQQPIFAKEPVETGLKEKEKQRNSLRKELKFWIDRFKNVSQQNIEPAVKNLASLRKKYNKIESEWQREVVYLRDVQTCILYAATQAMKTSDEAKRTDLAAALKHILSPVEQIQTGHFQKIRIIIQSLREVEGEKNVDPWELQNLKQIPEILKKGLELMGENPEREDTNLDQLQERLEKTIKAIFENPPRQYIYLVSLGVLHLFGFSIDSFMFDRLLTKEDVGNMTQQLETHFQNIEDVPNKVKQAYTLGIGLSCLEGKHTIVQYMLDQMSESLCQELKVFCRPKDPVSINKLQATVYELLRNNGIEFSLLPLVNSLKVQMFGCRGEVFQRSNTEAHDESINHETKLILEALGLMKYYPQKLTYNDVITLGTDVYHDVDKEPASLPELPWYFMKRVIGLDSETRESCHLVHFLENESDDDDSGDEEENTFSAVHPLDLIYTIFLCADDFLRQELADKMAKCQYAVPFILPSVESSGENLVLHWGLKSMTRTFYKNNNLVNRTLVDAEAPLVACLNIGKETSWKSKLLNKMLSPQQETFWHQGLKGGNSEQRISQGMVEVAWYLPGRHGNNKYQYPVTFVNVRQNATDSKPLCQRLSNSSAVTCVFVEDIGDDLKMFLKQTTSLENVLVVILHQKEKEKDVKEKSKQLQLEFNLGKHQVIRKAAIDANFDAVYQLLKKGVEYMITLASHFGSLSTFVMHAEDTEGMKVDDKKCYIGQMAADSILKDVDYYNHQTPGSAKDRILSCQSDLTSRQEIASIDKELCRQRKLGENMTVQSYWYDLIDKKWQLQLNQLLRPMSDPFKYFLHCLVSLDDTDKKYFLQSLKLGLNERSTQQLQPLYDEYEKCRLEDESEERDKKLKNLDQKLTHGSLGIEHFFREIAVMYENISALKEKLLSEDADEILDRLASIMALLLMEGQAVEIMDGEMPSLFRWPG